MYKYVKDKTEEKYFDTVCNNTNDASFEYLDVEQSEVDGRWYLPEECPHLTPEQEAQKERERLDALTLTPADVERALYKAKGMDFEDLKALIAQQAPQIDMKGLAIEFRANNFYRGVVVGGIRLIDTVGALLGYTPKDMDYLFEHKELPQEETNEGNSEVEGEDESTTDTVV